MQYQLNGSTSEKLLRASKNHRGPALDPPQTSLGKGGTFQRPRALTEHLPLPKEDAMDWNRVEGNWKQVKGKVKEQWGKLTDDDLDVVEGKQDQLEGKIQERYGLAKDKARAEVESWYSRQKWH